jgi:hypothetical protein
LASIRSVASAGSILSVGSAGSILSIGSAGSILSLGSAGSLLSVGSAGSILSVRSSEAILHRDGRRMTSSELLAHVGVVTAIGLASGILATIAHRTARRWAA